MQGTTPSEHMEAHSLRKTSSRGKGCMQGGGQCCRGEKGRECCCRAEATGQHSQAANLLMVSGQVSRRLLDSTHLA
jgi:hypothetical protein